eukprot:6802889-Ditylum_brightwellii.AAC.1
MPIPDPLRMPTLPPPTSSTKPPGGALLSSVNGGAFVNGGPVVSFQPLEIGANGEAPPINRAMLLYVPFQQSEIIASARAKSTTPITAVTYQPPIWCISESYFPNKKLDTLPPRLAQPLLNYTRHYQVVGSNAFDPTFVMKALHRLDQLVLANKQVTVDGTNNAVTAAAKQPPPIKLLQRDVYALEWLKDEKGSSAPRSSRNQEHFPVLVRGAGRPSLSEGEENMLGIGVLHHPQGAAATGDGAKLSTLTLLPPEPHILLPLLVRAAEAEHRA